MLKNLLFQQNKLHFFTFASAKVTVTYKNQIIESHLHLATQQRCYPYLASDMFIDTPKLLFDVG